MIFYEESIRNFTNGYTMEHFFEPRKARNTRNLGWGLGALTCGAGPLKSLNYAESARVLKLS